MARTAFGNGPMNLRLRPVGSLQIEDNEIGKVCPVLVFASEYQELVTLVQCRRMAYQDSLALAITNSTG